jgi:hypothetical protein
VIVLAIAVAVGVSVGKQLAKHHTATGSGAHVTTYLPGTTAR